MNIYKKGNVLLLSLFLIAFCVSIIGLIYSYNKRIIIINSQEKANYSEVNSKTSEVFIDLYLINKMGEDLWGLNEISSDVPIPQIGRFEKTVNWRSQNAEILQMNGINFGNPPPTSATINTSKGSFNHSSNVDWESNRNQTYQDLINKCISKSENFVYNVFENLDKNIKRDKVKVTPGTTQRNLQIEYLVNIKKIGNIQIKLTYKVMIEYILKVSYQIIANGTAETNSTPVYEDRIITDENGNQQKIQILTGYDNTATIEVDFEVNKESLAIIKNLKIERIENKEEE